MVPNRPFGKCGPWPDCEGPQPDDVKEYEDEEEVEEDVAVCEEEKPKKCDQFKAPDGVPGRFGFILGTSSKCRKGRANPPDECAVRWMTRVNSRSGPWYLA